MKHKFLDKISKVLCSALIVAAMMIPTNKVKANNVVNDRRAGLIQSYAGKYNAETGSLDKLTKQELQALGVFVSNFYTPYVTNLNFQGKEEGKKEDNKDSTYMQLVEQLKSVSALDEELTKNIVDTVIGFSVDSIKSNTLQLGFMEEGGKDIIPVNTKAYQTTEAVSYMEFIDLVAGDGKLTKDNYDLVAIDSNGNYNNKVSVLKYYSILAGMKKPIGVLYYNNNGKKNIVFDFAVYTQEGHPKRADMTPAQTSFLTVLANQQKGKSLASFFLTKEWQELIEKKGHKFEQRNHDDMRDNFFKDKGNKEKVYNHSVFGWTMGVDAFGTLAIRSGNDYIVIMPAAMNPFIYKVKDSNTTGKVLPLNNLYSMSIAKKLRDDKKDGLLNASGGNYVENSTNNYPIDLARLQKDLGSFYRKNNENGNALMFATDARYVENFDLANFADDVGSDFLRYAPTRFSGDFFGMITTRGDGAYDVGDTILGFGDHPGSIKAFFSKDNHGFGNTKALFNGKSVKDTFIKYNELSNTEKEIIEKAFSIVNYEFPLVPIPIWTDKDAKVSKDDKSTKLLTYLYPYFASYFSGAGGDYVRIAPLLDNYSKSNIDVVGNILLYDKWGLAGITDKKESILKNLHSVFLYDKEGKLRNNIANSGDVEIRSADGLYASQEFSSQAAGISQMAQEKNVLGNLFLTYVLAMERQFANENLGWSFDFSNFNDLNDMTIQQKKETSALTQEQLFDLQKYTYLAMDINSEAGLRYKQELQKQYASSGLRGVYEDIAGMSVSSVLSGKPTISGNVNITSLPKLDDYGWGRSFVTFVTNMIYTFFLVLVVVNIIAVAFKIKTFKRALITVLVVLLNITALPAIMGHSHNITNATLDTIYSKKYMHWLLTQHQAYIDDLDTVAARLDYENKVSELSVDKIIAANTEGTSFKGKASPVMIKWMSPKKNNYLAEVQKILDTETQSSSAVKNILNKFYKASVGNEEYLTDKNALFLYRNVIDINNYARFIYGNTGKDVLYDKVSNNGATSNAIGHQYESINAALERIGLSEIETNYLSRGRSNSITTRVDNGFINDLSNGVSGGNSNRTKRYTLPISSLQIADASKITINDNARKTRIGINQELYNVNPSNFNRVTTPLAKQVGLDNTSVSSAELASIAGYSLYTESPYYYFLFNLYDNGLTILRDRNAVVQDDKDKPTTNTPQVQDDTNKVDPSIKKLLFSRNNSYFYNNKIDNNKQGYGELKDYMDFGTLFNVVIPYMDKANQPLIEYSNKFGTKIYEGVDIDQSLEQVYKQKPNTNEAMKYWHNANINRLYAPYSAWVDVLKSSSYTKPQNIQYAGKTYTVSDPTNPMTYPKEQDGTFIRPMIFSASEMKYYGLKEQDLTTVERKIVAVNRKTYEDILMLVNYANYDPNVIGNAFAMIATFNFNNEFSTGFKALKGDNTHVMYPLGFEIKSFGFDAYIRMVLSQDETIAGAIISDGGKNNVIDVIFKKGDIVTGVLLIFLAVLSMMIMPLVKILVVVIVFVLVMLAILVSDRRFKILVLLLATRVLTFLHGLIYSMFLSNGLTQVTGELQPVIKFDNPTITILVLIALTLATIILFGIIVIVGWKELLATSVEAFAQIKKFARQASEVFVNHTGAVGRSVSNGFSTLARVTGLDAISEGVRGIREDLSFGGNETSDPNVEQEIVNGANEQQTQENYDSLEDMETNNTEALDEEKQDLDDIIEQGREKREESSSESLEDTKTNNEQPLEENDVNDQPLE